MLEKIRVAVEETGGSLANLVKTNVFIKDASAQATYREIEQAFFREHAPEVAAAPPASTVFVMTELPRPEFLVEVEAFAVADASVPGWPLHRRAGTADAAESVTAGKLVFVSACHGRAGVASAPESIEREVSAALDTLGDALARAGSAISEILKISLMLTDATDYPKLQSTLLAFYREHAPQLIETPPATTFMEVVTIVPFGTRFQIDAVAVAEPR